MITGMDFKLNLLYQATLNVTNLDQTLSDYNKEMITNIKPNSPFQLNKPAPHVIKSTCQNHLKVMKLFF